MITDTENKRKEDILKDMLKDNYKKQKNIPEDRPNTLIEENINTKFDTYAGYNVKQTDLEYLRVMKISMMGGKAFTDYLFESSEIKIGRTKFEVHLVIGMQRFKSKEVDVGVEPSFEDIFYAVLQEPSNKVPLEITSLLRLKQPIEIHLFEKKNADLTLLSVKKIEWRYLLTVNNKGRIFLAEEMYGFSARNNIAIGVLNLELSIVGGGSTAWCKDSVLKDQIVNEIKNDKELIKECFERSERFYKEYKSNRIENEDRYLKIWTESVFDREYRPIFEYVNPINPSSITRLLETPLHCLRFVSLIPYRRPISDSVKNEVLLDTKTFLSLGYGSSAEHAILLCSLLLSFRMNAYVAVGINNNTHYYAVIVINFNSEEVVMWDACHGEKISVKDPRIYKYMRKICCMFNNQIMYALNQDTDDIMQVDFDIKNQYTWKYFANTNEYFNHKLNYDVYPIRLPRGDSNNIAIDIEDNIRDYISTFRGNVGKKTEFDQSLEIVLSQALCNYELERISGCTFGQGEFQMSLKNCVLEGSSFRGVPVHLKSLLELHEVLESLKEKDDVREVLNQDGMAVRHAVRVKVQMYPEEICAVWVMIACTWKSNTVTAKKK